MIDAVTRAGIVGAGTMGVGIGMSFADAGIEVRIVDAEPAALERARETIASTYEGALRKGRIDESTARMRLQRIALASDAAELRDVDVAIEAVYEDLALKREIFAQLDETIGKDALLATNTSTLDVDAIGAASLRPQRTLGLHFFSPANRMKLVEIVRGAATSPRTVERALSLVRTLGKTGVVVANADGFVGNRMLLRYRREAELMLEEGATPAQVDAALRGFGFAMGPFEVSDLAGLDIAFRAKQERTARGGLPFRQSRIPDRLVALGRLGQKTGAGYYRYEPGDRTPHADEQTAAVVQDERNVLSLFARSIDDEEIVERCLLALYMEGERILAEGGAAGEDDIDTIWRLGYGFPSDKVGPMAYARSLGTGVARERIAERAQTDPAFWQTAAVTLP